MLPRLRVNFQTHNFMRVENIRASCPCCVMTSKHSSNSEATDDRGLEEGEDTSVTLLGRMCSRVSLGATGLPSDAVSAELWARVLVSVREEMEVIEGLFGRQGRRRVKSGMGRLTN